MSMHLMTQAWKLAMPATPKMALLAMCDWANDDGGSLFPSVSQVALRVSCSDRQAQRVLHALVEMGYLAVIGNLTGGAPGQTRQYRINARRIEKEGAEADKARAEQLAKSGQKHSRQTANTGDMDGGRRVTNAAETGDTHVTGDKLSRVTNAAETGDMDGSRRVTNEAETGDTHVTQTTIEPPIEPPGNHQYALARPGDVTEQVWSDFLALRKEKRSKLTSTALAAIRNAAAKAGFTLQAALELCCERGWQSFRAEWISPLAVGHGAKPGLSKTDALRERNRENLRQWREQSEVGSHAIV